MRTHSGQPLRETAGPIRNIDDLRRVATILARRFDLPRAPTVEVGYVPWKGPSTSLVDSAGIPLGHFTIARWAVRGKFRRAPDDLEYQLVCAVGSWLDCHRRHSSDQENRPGLLDETGTREVLVAWYGPDAASEIITARTRNWRITKWIFLAWVGILVLVSILSWFRG